MGAVQSSASLSTPLQRKSVFNGGKPSVEAIATLLGSGRTRNVVVVAGAGISVSAGIPDFRTPGTGLYANLQRFRLPRPEAIFDSEFTRQHPLASAEAEQRRQHHPPIRLSAARA